MSRLPLKAVVEARLAELNRNPFEAANKAEAERNFFNDILNDKKRSVRDSSLPKVARGLDLTMDELTARMFPSLRPPEPPKGNVPLAERIIPGEDLVGRDKNIPVYAAAQAGNGHEIVTVDPIDWVKTPEPLARVKGGYGLLVVSDSMEPKYEAGDIVLVNPHLPPTRETNVVLYSVFEPGGEADALVKRLVKFTSTEWHLRQWNPPEGQERDFVLKRSDWPICHRIVGTYDRR